MLQGDYKVRNLVMGEREVWYIKIMTRDAMGCVYDVYRGSRPGAMGFDVELTLAYNVREI